jgi:hypothetical protein
MVEEHGKEVTPSKSTSEISHVNHRGKYLEISFRVILARRCLPLERRVAPDEHGILRIQSDAKRPRAWAGPSIRISKFCHTYLRSAKSYDLAIDCVPIKQKGFFYQVSTLFKSQAFKTSHKLSWNMGAQLLFRFGIYSSSKLL